MKTCFSLLMCSLLPFNSIYSQRYLEKGYIITNNIDTISGMINLKSDNFLSKICEFRSESEANPIVYLPGEIRGYFVKNKHMVSTSVKIDTMQKDVYLELLIEGIVKLYRYADDQDGCYFIEKDSVMYPLTNKEVRTQTKYMDYLKNSNQYYGVLKFLFREYPQSLGNSVNFYNTKGLVKVTKNYHNGVCKEYECIDYTKSLKSGYSIEPYFGYTLSSLEINNSKSACRDFGLETGLFLRIRSPLMNHSLNFLAGITFVKYDYYGIISSDVIHRYLMEDGSIYEDIVILKFHTGLKQSLINLPIILEYALSSGKIQPFITVGLNNTIAIYTDYYLRSIEIDYNRWYYYGFLGGLGLKYNASKVSSFALISKYAFRKNPFMENYFNTYGIFVSYTHSFL